MKIFYLILAVCLIGGCASSKQTYSADGEIAHSLNCSGTARNWGMCYEKAGEICGAKGYDILTKEGEQGASVAGSSSGNSSGVYGSSLHFRTMTIACKD
jgi:predicted alpha/beta hydrolase